MAKDERRWLSAPFRPEATEPWHTLTTYTWPFEALDRYVRGSGDYPWTAGLRTPTGPVQLRVPHPHDVRTVNEIFCRRDYGSDAPEVMVDIGGTIGVSATFWLSRSVYHHEAALGPVAGPAPFLIDPVGRYSGWPSTRTSRDKVEVQVECVGRIDLVKVDTESSEEAIVAAIPPDTRAAIAQIIYEYPGGVRHLTP